MNYKKRTDVVAIKYPPSGKEVYFKNATWTNAGIETKHYDEKDIILDLDKPKNNIDKILFPMIEKYL